MAFFSDLLYGFYMYGFQWLIFKHENADLSYVYNKIYNKYRKNCWMVRMPKLVIILVLSIPPQTNAVIGITYLQLAFY